MSKELKVVYRDFKVKYSVIPNEIVLQPKYNRAKKKADDIKLTRNYIGKRDDDYAYPIELSVINIRTIVTKEQMAQMEYKVKE